MSKTLPDWNRIAGNLEKLSQTKHISGPQAKAMHDAMEEVCKSFAYQESPNGVTTCIKIVRDESLGLAFAPAGELPDYVRARYVALALEDWIKSRKAVLLHQLGLESPYSHREEKHDVHYAHA